MQEYNRYFIVRTKMREDGDVDFEKNEAYDQASAYNKYYTLKAAAYVDTTYPQIAISVFDNALRQIEQCIIDTQYVAPEENSDEEKSETT